MATGAAATSGRRGGRSSHCWLCSQRRPPTLGLSAPICPAGLGIRSSLKFFLGLTSWESGVAETSQTTLRGSRIHKCKTGPVPRAALPPLLLPAVRCCLGARPVQQSVPITSFAWNLVTYSPARPMCSGAQLQSCPFWEALPARLLPPGLLRLPRSELLLLSLAISAAAHQAASGSWAPRGTLDRRKPLQ